jgi:hypothetical protein
MFLFLKKKDFSMIWFSSKDEQGVLTSSLLNQIIGTGPNIKWSTGSNRLQRAAQSASQSSCLVS